MTIIYQQGQAPQTARRKLDEAFRTTLDADDYRWLDSHYPAYLSIIEQFRFDPDVTPENVESFFNSEMGGNRERFAKACAGALRHIRKDD